MKKSVFVIFVLAALFSACNNENTSVPTPDNNGNGDKQEEPAPSKQEMLLGTWTIDVATFNGTPDGSNRGDKIEFKSTGYYTKESLTGMWMWKEDSTGIICDYQKQYESDWTILKFDENTLNVELYFTGNPGKFHWEMSKDQ